MSHRVTLLTIVLTLVIHIYICHTFGLPSKFEGNAELIQVYKDGTRVFRYHTETGEERYVYITNDAKGYPIKIRYSKYLNNPGEIVSTPIDLVIPGGTKFTTKFVSPFASFSQTKFEPM